MKDRIIAVLCLFLSSLVGIGWALEVPWMLSMLPGTVTMKPLTALCFGLTAASSVLLSIRSKAAKETAIAPALAVMAIMFASMSTHSPVFSFAQEPVHLAVQSEAPGLPSLGTMICFQLLSLSVIGIALKRRWAKLASIIPVIAGAVGLLGYIFNIPILFYRLEGVSTAMAILTCLMFIALGVERFRYQTKQ